MSPRCLRARGAQISNKNGQSHGLTVLKRAGNGLGNRLIDRRTVTAKALAKWRTDLVDDLGGANAISTQQSALVDLAVKSKLLLDSIDAWLLSRRRSSTRAKNLSFRLCCSARLADGLAHYLAQLGLERRRKDDDDTGEE
jgi:hypothetical protein